MKRTIGLSMMIVGFGRVDAGPDLVLSSPELKP
jgi:hypothetical protein